MRQATKPNVESTNSSTASSGGTYYTEDNGYEYGWHPMGDHAPNYEIENEIGTHCCVIVHNVHYEVTPEVGKKCFLQVKVRRFMIGNMDIGHGMKVMDMLVFMYQITSIKH